MIKLSESRSPGRLAANVLLLLVSATLPLAAAEVSVRALGFLRADRQAMAATEAAPAEREARSTKHRLHPFLGWTRNDFERDLAEYLTVPEDDFVIGVFGGSVAKHLVGSSGRWIAQALTRERPDLKTVRVLRFGIGGYKQPQQLFLLCQALLLGIPLDLVVNLDGYNEVAFGSSNREAGFHPLYPKMSLLTTLADLSRASPSPAALELSGAVLAAKRRADELRAWPSRVPLLGRSELVKALLGRWVRQAEAKAARFEMELQELAPADSNGRFAQLEAPCLDGSQDCWELIAELWGRSSRLMASVSTDAGVPYLHILQPNQYVAGSKELSSEERSTAYDPSLPASRAAQLGYPHLVRQGETLRQQGVNYHDLRMLFRDQRSTVYRDACCHLNDPGNQLLAAAVVDLIVAALDEAPARAAA